MPKTTFNRLQVIAICLSSSEVDLLGSFFSAISNQQKDICFIVLYKGLDAERIVKKLQDKYGFHFQVDADQWVIGKNQYLFISEAYPTFAIQEEVNSKTITHHFAFHAFEYQLDQLSVHQKVFLHFNINLGQSVFGMLKFNSSETFFLSKNSSTAFKPNLIVTPANIIQLILDYWDKNNFNKKAENLAVNEHVLDAFDEFLDIICLINAEGEFVKLSKATKKVWGFLPEELVGKKYIDFVYEEDIPKTKAIAEEIMQGLVVTTFENRYVCKDASLKHMLWSAKWDNTNQMMYCVARDASELVDTQKALSESYKQLKEAQSLAKIGS